MLDTRKTLNIFLHNIHISTEEETKRYIGTSHAQVYNSAHGKAGLSVVAFPFHPLDEQSMP